MNTNIGIDDLFALRAILQDEYENEVDIIRELKFELLNAGMSPQEIPNFLKQFYETYGITMTIEQIHEALGQNQQQLYLEANIVNFMNSLANLNIQHEIQNQENHDEDDEGDDDGDSVIDDDADVFAEVDAMNNEENSDLSSNTHQNQQVVFTMDPTGTDIQIVANNNLNNTNGENVQSNQMTMPMIIPISAQNNPFNLDNILSNLLGSQQMLTLPPLIQMPLGGMLNHGSTGDVVSTLDDSEEDKLVKYKLEEKREENCSICMMNMEREQHVCDLPCKHTYHEECIMPWLKQYNYKCPICRQEVGRPKYNY